MGLFLLKTKLLSTNIMLFFKILKLKYIEIKIIYAEDKLEYMQKIINKKPNLFIVK